MFNKITDIKKLTLNEGEVLLVKIPRGTMPASRWERESRLLREALSTFLLTNQIIIYGDDLEFTTVTKDKV